ncbi:roadblock/LC7 domain-containing protein [Kluyvera sp. EC_51]|uniref:roadblock/LC7 domain-containing protein n=1 Tax=Kluyvera sp. EC_51 TaxID=2584089 RepID=UPI001C6FDD73|nr:roadblock/LC7 domain-containing protein [Kluyvera sp. EC_51]MBW9462100.1 roadblock/LC7 domain-containing protein [Kluyvera sp. EC_51]
MINITSLFWRIVMGLHKLPFDIYATKSDEDEPLMKPSLETRNEPCIATKGAEVEGAEIEGAEIEDAGIEDAGIEGVEIREVPEALIAALNIELNEFYKQNTLLQNIIVSTEDGFEVASLLTAGNELHVRKVSALASSLLGISSAMLKEVGSGEQNTVFMESDDSMILFNRIIVAKHILCLMAITEKDEPIGQIFWRMKNLSESIIEICKKII